MFFTFTNFSTKIPLQNSFLIDAFWNIQFKDFRYNCNIFSIFFSYEYFILVNVNRVLGIDFPIDIIDKEGGDVG